MSVVVEFPCVPNLKKYHSQTTLEQYFSPDAPVGSGERTRGSRGEHLDHGTPVFAKHLCLSIAKGTRASTASEQGALSTASRTTPHTIVGHLSETLCKGQQASIKLPLRQRLCPKSEGVQTKRRLADRRNDDQTPSPSRHHPVTPSSRSLSKRLPTLSEQ